MNIELVNEYTSDNLGDATIYETLAQLGQPHPVLSNLSQSGRQFVRGLADGQPGESAAPAVHVSVGGDIFNNARPNLVTRRFLANARALAACPPAHTFLFGQTIPASCRGLAFQGLAWVLKRLSGVTVRDERSHSRLRAAGVNAQLSWDIALAYQPRSGAQRAGQALFNQAGLDADRTVLFSVREFDAMYPQDGERFEAAMADLSNRLHKRGHQPAVLIQAQATGTDSDMAMALRLKASVPDLAILSPFELADQHHPVDTLIGALALAQGVVAVRYHTAVLRLLAGRLPFSLHYSTKGEDLARRLDLPGQSLEQFDPAVALAGIEQAAARSFDVEPLRQGVQTAFREQLRKAAQGLS